MSPTFLYLHGFASSPASRKARLFVERAAARGISLVAPDLAQGDFRNLTITRQLAVVEKIAAGRPVSLIGSSMGGYLAALYCARHPEARQAVLLAPAFDFAARWPATLGPERFARWERDGEMSFYHYGEGRELPLSFELIRDARRYEPFPATTQPVLIFHGRRDEVVPARLSEQFAALRSQVELHLVDSGHDLLDVIDFIWERSAEFLFSPPANQPSSAACC